MSKCNKRPIFHFKMKNCQSWENKEGTQHFSHCIDWKQKGRSKSCYKAIKCDKCAMFRSRRNTTATSLSQTGLGHLHHTPAQSSQNLNSQISNSSSLHPAQLGGNTVNNCRLHLISSLGRWDISPDVPGDPGGAWLVPRAAREHPDPPLRRRHGLHKGKQRGRKYTANRL